jgi:hypothetical protein
MSRLATSLAAALLTVLAGGAVADDTITHEGSEVLQAFRDAK